MEVEWVAQERKEGTTCRGGILRTAFGTTALLQKLEGLLGSAEHCYFIYEACLYFMCILLTTYHPLLELPHLSGWGDG